MVAEPNDVETFAGAQVVDIPVVGSPVVDASVIKISTSTLSSIVVADGFDVFGSTGVVVAVVELFDPLCNLLTVRS